MTITRTPLCTYKRCPFPTDPWAHVCAVCEAPAVEHHHKEPRGMGGSKVRDVKENIIMLCHTHHEEAHGAVTPEGKAVSAAGSLPGFSGLPSPVAASGASSDGGEAGVSVVRGFPQSSPPSPGGFTSRPEQDAGRRDSRGGHNPPRAVTPPCPVCQSDGDRYIERDCRKCGGAGVYGKEQA